MDRYTIIAPEGMILTDGFGYYTKVTLGDWDKAENYRKITEVEYNEMIERQNEVNAYDV